MKKHIYNINQYLLENYPTVWNTRIVWMLLASIGFHMLFFLLGIFALSNPETLQKTGASSVFFKSGVVFFSIVISVLQLVVWLIYLFKNNSFKNFYPTAKTRIFLQFICYLVIVFFSITYYFSHYVGLKTYIGYTYPDKEVKKDIDIANKSAVFFSHDVNDYTINNCKYPFPFDSIYIKFSDAHPYSRYKWLDNQYTFYTIYTVHSKDVKEGKPVEGYEYVRRTKDGEIIYFFKDHEVDVLKYKNNVNADSDYVLFSEKNFYKDSTYSQFKGIKIKRPIGNLTYAGDLEYKNKGIVKTQYYKSNKQDLTQYKIDVSPSYKYYSKLFHSKTEPEYYMRLHKQRVLRSVQNKGAYQLLKRNDTVEIKQLLQSFLTVANKYKIRNNISTDKWFNLVYQPDDFKINLFIRKKKDLSDVQKTVDCIRKELTKSERFQYERTTDYYIETPELNTVFYNIYKVKKDTSYKEAIHVFLWLSFSLAFLIFIFRISSLRAFIFTLISAGLFMILVPLLTISYGYIFGRGFFSNNMALIISIIISIIIVGVSNLFIEKLSKKIMAIFVNLSLVAFVVFVGFIIELISKYQRSNCALYSRDDCFILINWLGISFSYILFLVGLAYLYYFSGMIKKWKGLPEG